jgi:hypothetical protein
MQHSLTGDRHFVGEGLTLGRGFEVFLLVMTVLFILAGILLTPESITPVNYEIFW